ncbi:NUDIX domain-containing protein [Streptomyces griseus]|uniref:NUDIX hydrolase n=1 Tax=Streptomyces TaxID=1883 RepID=UPI0001C1A14E|nr:MULTISPECIES: NUDIX domain-containing protein [Streptomyces]EGE39592.1 NUDIX hydrolase [Streptomyces sp. ACT-1]
MNTPAAAPRDAGELVPYCDHTSVGVLVHSPDGLLMFQRATPPWGIAPVAGHIDGHGSPEQAAVTETLEEVGLHITRLQLVHTQWKPNPCRRTPRGPVGHQWSVFDAEASGDLRPSARETRSPRWMTTDTLQQAAQRTAAYAAGELRREDWEQTPGLEPVWCGLLSTLGLIRLEQADRARIQSAR